MKRYHTQADSPNTAAEFMPAIEGVSSIALAVHGDDRGNLVAFDRNQNLPFDLKRVYFIFDVPGGVRRAGHATSAEAVFVVLHGSVRLTCDNGRERASYTFSEPTSGLHVRPGVLVHTDQFSPGAVLVVLTSLPYSDVAYSQFPVYHNEN